jgi:predicted secreted protein
MTITAAVALYFVIWWLVLFAVLPFGIRSQREAGDVVPGSDPGAPAATNLRRVVLWTSVIALGVFLLVWFVYVENVFDFALFRDLIPR